MLPFSSNCITNDASFKEVQLVLSPQLNLMNNVGGAVNTLTQMGTTCALVLLVNVTRPSLQYDKGLLSGCLMSPKH